MKQILILSLVLIFAACKKQGMEDVYSDRYPEDQYRPFFAADWGADVKGSNVKSLIKHGEGGSISLSSRRYYNWSTRQEDIRFYINRYEKVYDDRSINYRIVESATYTYTMCKPNIVKIEKIPGLDSKDQSTTWDNDILGYWVAYKNTKGRRMQSLDQQKSIDLN